VQALVSDMDCAFESLTHSNLDLLTKSWMFEVVGGVGVVFGKQWTLSVVDEVHNFQKPNKMFWVVKSIHSTPNSFIAMMATLVQMCPAVCAQTLISAIILLTN